MKYNQVHIAVLNLNIANAPAISEYIRNLALS